MQIVLADDLVSHPTYQQEARRYLPAYKALLRRIRPAEDGPITVQVTQQVIADEVALGTRTVGKFLQWMESDLGWLAIGSPQAHGGATYTLGTWKGGRPLLKINRWAKQTLKVRRAVKVLIRKSGQSADELIRKSGTFAYEESRTYNDLPPESVPNADELIRKSGTFAYEEPVIRKSQAGGAEIRRGRKVRKTLNLRGSSRVGDGPLARGRTCARDARARVDDGEKKTKRRTFARARGGAGAPSHRMVPRAKWNSDHAWGHLREFWEEVHGEPLGLPSTAGLERLRGFLRNVLKGEVGPIVETGEWLVANWEALQKELKLTGRPSPGLLVGYWDSLRALRDAGFPTPAGPDRGHEASEYEDGWGDVLDT